jgi:hypothetical protein
VRYCRSSIGLQRLVHVKLLYHVAKSVGSVLILFSLALTKNSSDMKPLMMRYCQSWRPCLWIWSPPFDAISVNKSLISLKYLSLHSHSRSFIPFISFVWRRVGSLATIVSSTWSCQFLLSFWRMKNSMFESLPCLFSSVFILLPLIRFVKLPALLLSLLLKLSNLPTLVNTFSRSSW